mmetsp:Transcript_20267/g.47018  ORF Transcript_20267/g.47018 Transcript_20267/m.47018 type:complete len:243 (+) Transcript_20267:545-1273(+)
MRSRRACCACSRSNRGRNCDESNPAGWHHRPGDALHVTTIARQGVACRGTAVLLHGMLASSRAMLGLGEALAAEGWHCVAIDILGFGRSPWPRAAESYSIDSQCEWIRATLLAQEIEGPIIFVGHSLGALLGGALALAPHPDVCGAALLALPYYDGMPGEARAGVGQRSWRGKFVLALIRWPVMAFCLCSLVCQQRWLWMALLRSAMCVLAKLGCISAATAQGWLYAVEVRCFVLSQHTLDR